MTSPACGCWAPSATRPLPGIRAEVVDDQGNPVAAGRGGYLVLRRPWPGMFRTLYNDDTRYVSNYFERFGPDTYFAGDGARALYDRAGVGAGRAPGGGRGGCDGRTRRAHRPDAALLRAAAIRLRAQRPAGGGAA